MSQHNRLHPANFEESLKITVEPIENGDDCSYLVYVAGHGAIQKQMAADKADVKATIDDALKDWETHCEQTRESGPLERTEVHGPVDLPAD